MKTYFLWILFAGLIWAVITNEFEDKLKDVKDQNASDVLSNKVHPIVASKVKNQTQTKKLVKAKKRAKRSIGVPWRKHKLTYTILKYTEDLTVGDQERIFKKAFDVWHKAAPQLKFQFKRSDPNVDIKISFVRGAHGDRHPFDGSGPIIAHVFYPEDGRMHFDDDQRFTDKSTRGTNLFASAVHEVGHALGMRHSEKKSSVMYRLSKKYTGKDITLDAEDIKRIRKLYRIHATDRTNAKCKDKNSGMCAMYKEHGYCSPDYKDVMEQNCPLSCGYCDS